ncbi:MAG: TonB-dependent receptor, partial [Acidobacteriota bacterium]|nr:TonB-dependent receptor [Acidobacteriota bacterium]
MKRYSAFLVTFFTLFLTCGLFAQNESSVRGNLAGTVFDASGAVVPKATVIMHGPTGDRTVTSDEVGRFAFDTLTPGFYVVRAEMAGFKAVEAKQIEVFTGKTSTVRLTLEAGGSNEVVEVSGSAIAVDTTSTAVATNLNDTFYQSIPISRGVTGLFYAAPGVASGGGTGTGNPSISGGTGLENNYVADGVSITDGGFGGIGVYSRIYGSLSTGINLSFVKEVQVKTGGFEAQYGKSTGGIVQIVTKSGSNEFHGSISGYFAPQNFEATRLFSDDFGAGGSQERFNLQGKIRHQSNYDADVQVGGHVPGFRDHLFFYGSFNPQWNTDHDQFAQYRNPSDLGTAGLAGPTQTHLGNYDVPVKVYSYAGKLTWRISDKHQIEASAFGDPTYGDMNANGNGGPQTASKTTFDKLQYGTRNFVARYNGNLTATWLANASWSWGHNNLSDTPFARGAYSILDYTQRNPCGAPLFNSDCSAPTDPLRGQYTRQGLGYYENTQGDNYGLAVDTQKTSNFLGQHTFSVGYNYDRSHYDGSKAYTGPRLAVDATTAATITTDPTLQSALVANGTTATFQLRARGSSSCITNPVTGGPGSRAAEIYVPGLSAAPVLVTDPITGLPVRQANDTCPDGGIGTYLLQTRGEYGDLNFKTTSLTHTAFAQDAWSLNKYVTINGGLRWEQQHVAGKNAKYTFNDNWSPRVGISVDPFGTRKTKVTANFGRYTESLPLDIAIRSLSAELDFPTSRWTPPTDGAGHVVINSDGTLNMSNFTVANNLFSSPGGSSAQSFDHAFGKGTRSEYLDEYQVGFEHEFGNSGVIFTTHYTDRRIKRIIEDNAALSPEAYQCCLNQFYTISNVSKNQDLFHNPVQILYNSTAAAVPSGCTSSGTNVTTFGQPTDSNGNVVTLPNGNDSFCIPNSFDAAGNQITGTYGADGVPDGFVDPVRVYKAVEFEDNKSFSKGWHLRTNYRIARLVGNYEGSFRNDNGQNDPNISSLFDFTRGDFNLLGQQFTPGVLNTDVHHLANGFVSYTFANHAKGLTMGSSVHFQTGIPINNL